MYIGMSTNSSNLAVGSSHVETRPQILEAPRSRLSDSEGAPPAQDVFIDGPVWNIWKGWL